MLKQASVGQLRRGEVTRDLGRVVIAMRFHPRGLRRELRDEYIAALAPDRGLFKSFKHWQRLKGHEAGFRKSRYDDRFRLDPAALSALERLAAESRRRDVYLVCQCEVGERCHREILMLLANRSFGAEVGPVFNDYRRARILREKAPKGRREYIRGRRAAPPRSASRAPRRRRSSARGSRPRTPA